MPGLLDFAFSDQALMGSPLTNIGIGLLQAGGPSKMPQSFLSNLGRAAGYAQDRGIQQSEIDARRQELAMTRARHEAQLAQFRFQQEELQRQQQLRQQQQQAFEALLPAFSEGEGGLSETQLGLLRALGPEAGLGVLQELAFRSPETLGFKDYPADAQLAMSMGLMPGTPEYAEFIRTANLPIQVTQSVTNTPSPEPGFRFVGGNPALGQEPIPGGPKDPAYVASTEAAKGQAQLEAKLAEQKPQATNYLRGLATKRDKVREIVERAKARKGAFTTGLLSIPARSLVPEARALANDVRQLVSLAGIQAIQAFRAEGGTTGGLTEQEFINFASGVEVLDQAEGEKEFHASLDSMLAEFDSIFQREQQHMRDTYGEDLLTGGGAQTGQPGGEIEVRWDPVSRRYVPVNQ